MYNSKTGLQCCAHVQLIFLPSQLVPGIDTQTSGVFAHLWKQHGWKRWIRHVALKPAIVLQHSGPEQSNHAHGSKQYQNRSHSVISQAQSECGVRTMNIHINQTKG